MARMKVGMRRCAPRLALEMPEAVTLEKRQVGKLRTTAPGSALPAWKRLLKKRARDAVHSCATPDDVRKLGEHHFRNMPGMMPGVLSEIGAAIGGWTAPDCEVIAHRLPAAVDLEQPGPSHLRKLAEDARDYARAAKAQATQRAYASDWRAFESWCVDKEVDPLPPNPQIVGLYLTALAKGDGIQAVRVATIDRRLSALCWHYRANGQPLDRGDRHIREVMQGIRNRHGRPPNEKEAVLGADIIRMTESLGRDLRGIRDRAILLLGFAGGFRRSEIVGLDCGPEQTLDGAGWLEFHEDGLIVRVRGKTGWRQVEIGPGSTDRTCPIVALRSWLDLGRVVHGPIFRRVTGDGKKIGSDRLNDRHVARLVKRTALEAGVRPDLSEGDRREKFSGHSLRAGLASSADVDDRLVQTQLGHASPTMTQRYKRRRDRFRINMTKIAGL